MAAKDDDESAREEGNPRIVELALEAVFKGSSKGKWSFGKRSELERQWAQRWQRRQRWREELMAEG